MNTNLTTSSTVLIVDDTPANLAYLSDALHEAGYRVLVAIDGDTALERLKLVTPDIILLDAVMPGRDGFSTCEAIREQQHGTDIPIIFMTGLMDTEHIVRAFKLGAMDYVIKPVRPEELLARIRAHIKRARITKRAQQSVESFGKAGITINHDATITWQTPRAREWLDKYFGSDQASCRNQLLRWLQQRNFPADERAMPLTISTDEGRLNIHYGNLVEGGEHLLLLDEQRNDLSGVRFKRAFQLTPRESEVLQWLAAGKTNRDIATILAMSPRTVNKHLERVYIKMGVETRSAAVAMAAQTLANPENDHQKHGAG